MKHNKHNKNFVFYVEPVEFNRNTEKELLQYCLGATLYMPGTKDILDKLLRKKLIGVTSMVMCFEDAIREEDVLEAEENVLNHLGAIADAIERAEINIDSIPLIFLRVRNTKQFGLFAKRLKKRETSALSGFVFPKFGSDNGRQFLEQLQELNQRLKEQLYGMPILEGRTIAYRESRVEELNGIRAAITPFRKYILNLRVGGTDFSSIFGVRRGINSSIYDILPVRDCLSDILNYFNRDDEGYTVSAPVWEYFLADKRDDINHLLEEDIHRSLLKRNLILNEAIDGLLREVLLDKANGFVGKTVIHPSHLQYVNAMQAVTKEEYEDALQILNTKGGVVKSTKSNKMNEINPHRNWAKRIYNRARAYGVIESEMDYLKLIAL
jgi:citrate lyase beta subunit